MKKSLSKLAILATLAVLSSSAMAYKVYERETNGGFLFGGQQTVSGVCNHGNSFAGSYSHSSERWEVVVNSPFKMGFSSSMHEAIRQACGE